MASVEARLIYDGDCPFCARYVKLVRLREHLRLELVNVREDMALRDRYLAKGMDLDEGMVLELEGARYHGTACVERLALMSTPSGIFNRLNVWVFSRPKLAAVVYPCLVWLRNVVLAVLRRPRLSRSD